MQMLRYQCYAGTDHAPTLQSRRVILSMAAAALTAAPNAMHCLAAMAAEQPPPETSPAERDPLSGPRGPRYLDPPAQAALDAALQEAVAKGKARAPSVMHSCGRALVSRTPRSLSTRHVAHADHTAGRQGVYFVQQPSGRMPRGCLMAEGHTTDTLCSLQVFIT